MPDARWAVFPMNLIMCLGLAACIRGPAQPADDLEKDAPMTHVHVPQGGEADADAVAARLDGIAVQSPMRADVPAASMQPLPPAPQGPVLTPAEWRMRALQFIDRLAVPSDTRPARVSEVLGMTLADRHGSYEARGELSGGGTYEVWVNALYRERPDKWTVGLSQLPAEAAPSCHFPLSMLRQHLAARGYSATEGVRRRDGGERALYRSTPTPERVAFVVSADVVGSVGGEQCIRELRVNANVPGDDP